MDYTLIINGVTVKEITKRGMTHKKSSGKMRLASTRKKLIRLAARDGMFCCYCEKPVQFEWMGKFSQRIVATFEHVIPKSRGGKHTLKNGKIACRPCNLHRADQKIEDFLVLLKQGYYEPELVRTRQIARIEEKRVDSHRRYLVREKRRMWAARKLWVANTMKLLYNVFVWKHGDAELG